MKSQPLEERGVPRADLPEVPVEFYFTTKASESAVKSLIAKLRHHLKAGSRPHADPSRVTPLARATGFDLARGTGMTLEAGLLRCAGFA
jgi:hypothetical protein